MGLSFIQGEPRSWPVSAGIGSNSPPHHDPEKDKPVSDNRRVVIAQ